jgi:hypothetical protein
MQEKMLELAYETLNYNADIHPELCWEEDTGFYFEGATSQDLAQFKKDNELANNLSQGEVENWIDKTVFNWTSDGKYNLTTKLS